VDLHLLNRDKRGAHFAVIGQKDFSIDASEFHLPQKSLSDVEAEISSTKLELKLIKEKVCKFAPLKQKVKDALHAREEAVTYAEVHDTIGSHGEISYLRGYCPTESIDKVREAAKKHGWGILTEEPTENDNVPTLLKFPRWTKPIKAVMEMLAILPGYREADISSVFLIFFSIFFAILIGDAGYGVLFLLITLYARSKMKKAPAYPFVLFEILSIVTIIWGMLTGNYFGIQPDALPKLLQGFQVEWLTGAAAQDNVMKLCFLIGAVHLTIAHIWNILALAPDKKAIAQLGWIGLVWSMYLTALNMVLGQTYPSFFVPMFAGSIALILLFMTSPKDMKSEWIHHAMFPLSIVNCFVDIVSYIRLFAVGLASLSVAQSFNDMAMQLGWKHIWTIPFMAMILLAGHALNIILCALGILVHGVRLNTLEFSLHKNLEWKGIPYQPFARKQQVEITE
jgi:V/A-type H+-transporting ATPase subunit I